MSTLIFNNQSSAPDAAGSGKSQLYAKTDGKVYAQVESGAEVAIQTGTDQVGKVLQVVEQTWNLDLTPAVTFSSDGSNTASTWQHAFSGTITPSSTTSKILLQATVQVYGADTVGNWDAPTVTANVHRLNSDGTTAFSFISGSGSEPTGGYWIYQRENHAIPSYQGGSITITRLDVPNSTDALVYNVVVRCAGNWTVCYMYGGVMIMQEIAG